MISLSVQTRVGASGLLKAGASGAASALSGPPPPGPRVAAVRQSSIPPAHSPPDLTYPRCDQPDSSRMGGGGWGTPQRAERQEEAGRALPPEPGWRRSQSAGETDRPIPGTWAAGTRCERPVSRRGGLGTALSHSGCARGDTAPAGPWGPSGPAGATRGGGRRVAPPWAQVTRARPGFCRRGSDPGGRNAAAPGPREQAEMARELSQEALLDFLCQAGGRVTNAALLGHFKSFLRDPAAPPGQQQRRRELFKGFVNSVAAVRQDPDGTKFVVLKRRYRDLLGEEGLQRPATVVPAEGPQRSRRRHDPDAEKQPAGAAARPEDAGGDGEVAGTHRGSRASPRRQTPGAAGTAQAPARCAAMETRGRCCWECRQNGWGPSLPGAPADPAAAWEEPERAQPARADPGTPGRPREGVPAKRAPVPATPVSPPANVEAAGSWTSPPALRPRPAPSRDPPELFTASSLNHSTQHLQQQRTREWVARCPKMPQALEQRPIRAWSVLPENFLQITSEIGPRVPETNSELPEPSLSSHSLFPVVAGESSETWSGNPPPIIFRSIRCQLSLQDLSDFVDQESHSSEESSSGPRESPEGSEEGLQVVLGSRGGGEFRNPAPGLSSEFPKESSSSRNPQGLKNRGDGSYSGQVPTGAKGLGDHPQELSPCPAPKFRRSVRRSARARRAKSSSSDEEQLSEDLLKRSLRPPRSRKSSRAGALPSPRVDAALTQKLADPKAVVAERGQSHSSWILSRDEPTAVIPHRPEHRSPLVPLDAREHEWIVRLASGSWIAVLTLFWEDPQLALHRDFLTGYTALHWIAKHGDLRALQDLVSGAQKAGITLDVNVRSSCGYTPLHLAAIHGHQGVIKLLVQRLASRVTVRDCSGKRPWQYLSSNTSGEIWQLLGAPRGKPIFPVYPLVQSSSPTRKVKSKEVSRNVTRKTSLAALLKNQHSKWKLANQYEKSHAPREREEYSD